ncbi:MAG TPA: ribonuclease domain-containing protein [Steroidobacteraceae bacterium]|nr:ribonuclease domain-containing protein [Steroidobacteraceae bacterium]
MSGKLRIVVVALALIAGMQWWSGHHGTGPDSAGAAASSVASAHYPDFLPPEAVDTLEAIRRGGPFPYARDGVVFQNRERLLPAQPAGYYREYTVPTPGSADRGARRIVTGGDPPEAYYYTDDHYRSFRRVEIHP